MRRPFPALATAAALALLATLWAPAPAAADLASSSFGELLAESQLIAHVRVAEIKVDPRLHSGYARLEVVEAYMGTAPDEPIRIEFSGEVHDQYQLAFGEDRLVFLRERDGKWTGTHYGRSYWPLYSTGDDEPELATPYTYPTSMLKFKAPHAALLEKAKFSPEVTNANQRWEGKTRRMIRMQRVVDAVKARATKKAK